VKHVSENKVNGEFRSLIGISSRRPKKTSSRAPLSVRFARQQRNLFDAFRAVSDFSRFRLRLGVDWASAFSILRFVIRLRGSVSLVATRVFSVCGVPLFAAGQSASGGGRFGLVFLLCGVLVRRFRLFVRVAFSLCVEIVKKEGMVTSVISAPGWNPPRPAGRVLRAGSIFLVRGVARCRRRPWGPSGWDGVSASVRVGAAGESALV